jgi:hypothetical protein
MAVSLPSTARTLPCLQPPRFQSTCPPALPANHQGSCTLPWFPAVPRRRMVRTVHCPLSQSLAQTMLMAKHPPSNGTYTEAAAHPTLPRGPRPLSTFLIPQFTPFDDPALGTPSAATFRAQFRPDTKTNSARAINRA